MSELNKFSESVVLGIHAMIELSKNLESGCTIKYLANKLEASEATLAKVLQLLRRSGLVIAQRGPEGGYKLAFSPDRITLLSIFEAIEGRVETSKCLLGSEQCKYEYCQLGRIIWAMSQRIKIYFENIKLSDLPITISKEEELSKIAI